MFQKEIVMGQPKRLIAKNKNSKNNLGWTLPQPTH
jgi:hypothetical protein